MHMPSLRSKASHSSIEGNEKLKRKWWEDELKQGGKNLM